MKAEIIADWISTAQVDQYAKENKEVYIVTKDNEQLILTYHRVKYAHGLHPHIIIVHIKDGVSNLLYQDIVDLNYGQIKHGTGNLEGEFTARENVETVWCALLKRLRQIENYDRVCGPEYVTSDGYCMICGKMTYHEEMCEE